MHKSIAKILVVVILFSCLGDVRLLAADEKFKLSVGILKEESLGFSETNQEDGRIITYPNGLNEAYTFKYYIEDGKKKVWEIKLDFNTEDENNFKLSAVSVDGNVKKANEKFSLRKLEGDGWKDSDIASLGGKIEDDEAGITSYYKTLDASSGNNNNTVNIRLEDIKLEDGKSYLEIKVQLEKDELTFSTNGIKRGLIVPFKLEGDEEDLQYTFSGVKNYKIQPQHFVKEQGEVVSKETIEYSSVADKNQKTNPGDRPGIVVEYDLIKIIDPGSSEVINCTNAKIINRLGNNGIKLDYIATPNAKSKVTYTVAGKETKMDGAVDSNEDKVKIYLAHSEVIKLLGTDTKIIPWDSLKYSTLINDVFISMSTEVGGKKISFEESIDGGATYLKYDMNKTPGESKKTIEITPYLTSDVMTYYIYTADNEQSLATDKLYYYQDEKPAHNQKEPIKTITNKGNNEKIYAEVDNINDYIRIVAVSESKKEYFSQIMYIKPNALSIKPETPTGLKATNLIVAPSKSNDTIPASVRLDLTWNAPNNFINDYLAKGDLYYEVILRTTAEDTSAPGSTPNAAYTKIYKVTKKEGAEGETPTVDITSITNAQEKGKYENGEILVEDVYLKRPESDENWEQIELDDSYWGEPYLEALDNIEAKQTLIDKETGKVYYLSIRAVYDSSEQTTDTSAGEGQKSTPLHASGESTPVAIGIDFTKETIPTVEKIEYNKDKEKIENRLVTSEIDFSYIDVTDYVDKMLTPAGLTLSGNTGNTYQGTYEFYLYKKGEKFDENKKEPLSSVDLGKAVDIESQKDKPVIKWETKINELIGPSQKDVLDGNLILKGLEPNQPYSIKVKVRLDLYNKDNKVVDQRYSTYSKEFTFTTTTQQNSPSIDERKPPAPADIKIKPVEGSNSSVDVEWNAADFVKDNDMTVYYEVVRTSRRLSESELKQNIKDLVDGEIASAVFTTLDPRQEKDQTPHYMSYTKEDGWVTLDSIGKEATQFRFRDDTLAPNSVYYYYIRTVCVIDEQEDKKVEDMTRVESDWIVGNITTDAIQPPTHLKVESSEKYEVTVSFDAAIPSGAEIPKDYAFEMEINTDSMDEPEILTEENGGIIADESNSKDTNSNGLRHFVYRIVKLESNTRYEIRVRIIDRTKKIEEVDPESGDQYAKSVYSEIVIARTDYDEADEDKKQQYEEYLKLFESEMKKIQNKPYWTVDEDKVYKYRDSYLQSDLQAGKQYHLVSAEGASSVGYYIAASTFQRMNELGVTLEAVLGESGMTIRSQTLLENNQVISEALEAIQEKEIQDYAIYISFYKESYSQSVKGETVISPKLTVDMKLIYLRSKESDIERSILENLDKIIADERDYFISKLDKENNKTVIDQVVVENLILKSVDNVEKALEKSVDKIMTNAERKQKDIESIDKAILISTQSTSILGSAYYYNAGWYSAEGYSNGNTLYVEARLLGAYIFTGQKGLENTVPTLAPYQGFISQYGLSEFFKLDPYYIKTAVTKQQVYGATAKVLGAQTGTDYYTYLKNKGIKGISKVAVSQKIRQDEAIYIMMQAYEMLYNRKINTIVITNKQSIQNIGAFQTIYRDYMYAAVELKIVETTNAKLYPSSELAVETVIKMLYKVGKR